MIWAIVIGIVFFFLIRFFNAFNKDNYDLHAQSLSKKFEIIANMINDAAFNGEGTVTVYDKREFNLYKAGENQLINFQYGTGHLTITWKYKYFQKEIVHQRQFNDVRNLSVFEQQKIGKQIINEMAIVIAKHKLDVIGNV
ncbi:MAG TPA: hypothetical protein VFI29_23765 [Hanamia sp.]|nr:hypothetical protein [Hanamia sp.]